MTRRLFTNNATTTLAAGISSGATSPIAISVTPGGGSLFPNPTAGFEFTATLVRSGAPATEEVVLVTARAGDVMTATRAQEGTTALTWNAGDTLTMLPTAGDMLAMAQFDDLQAQGANYAIDTGTANAYVVGLTPAVSAHVLGMPIRWKAAHSSNAACTFNDGFGAAALILPDGSPPAIFAGGIYTSCWNGTAFQTYTSGYAIAPAEITAAGLTGGLLPINLNYPRGHVYRYGVNTTPGTTDMTAIANAVAIACRQGNYPLQLPGETMLVSGPLNFSGLYVIGLGNPFGGPSLIQANGNQFDVVTTTGLCTFYNFNVDGGNPSRTAGLLGDNFSLRATSPAHPYLVSFFNVGSTNAKGSLCYIERGGYTSFSHFHGLNAGRHGLECFGLSTDECTTIRDYGGSQFGGTNGFGIKLTECASCAFHDTILENTQGIQLNGIDNRTLTFDGVYQEVTSGVSFTASISGSTMTVSAVASGFLAAGQPIATGAAAGTIITGPISVAVPGGPGTYTVSISQTVGSTAMTVTPQFITDSSAGIGLRIVGCFGGNSSLPAFLNWQDVHYGGNSNLTEGAVPFAGRIQQNDSGELTTSTTGGVDVTVNTVSVPPGSWIFTAELQTRQNTGSNLLQAACLITPNAALSGLNNGTSNAAFLPGAAEATYNPGVAMDQRLFCFLLYQNTTGANVNVYLRAHLNFSGAGSLAYRGYVNAIKFQ